MAVCCVYLLLLLCSLRLTRSLEEDRTQRLVYRNTIQMKQARYKDLLVIVFWSLFGSWEPFLVFAWTLFIRLLPDISVWSTRPSHSQARMQPGSPLRHSVNHTIVKKMLLHGLCSEHPTTCSAFALVLASCLPLFLSQSTFGNLYIPSDKEEACRISLVIDSLNNNEDHWRISGAVTAQSREMPLLLFNVWCLWSTDLQSLTWNWIAFYQKPLIWHHMSLN